MPANETAATPAVETTAAEPVVSESLSNDSSTFSDASTPEVVSEPVDTGADKATVDTGTPTEEAFEPDGGLLSLARDLNITEEKLRSFKSEDKALAYLQARADALAEVEQSRQPETNGRARQREPLPEVPEFKLPDEVDPAIREAFASLHGFTRKQQEQLARQAQTLEAFIQYAQDQSQKAEQESFDTAMQQLGEEYVEIFGKGHGAELQKASPGLFKNRQRVFTAFERMRDLRNPGETTEALVRRAVYATFPDRIEAMIRRKMVGKAQTQSSKKTETTLSRSAPEKPKTERQIQREFEAALAGAGYGEPPGEDKGTFA